MTETIEKKTFAVDMKLVWACAVGIGYIVYTGTNTLNAIDARLKLVEAQKETVPHLEEAQRKNEADIKELQATSTAIKKTLDETSLDVKALNSQMQTLVSTLKK